MIMVKINEGGNLHTAPACPTQYIPNIDIADLHCLRFSGGTHLTTQDIGFPSKSCTAVPFSSSNGLPFHPILRLSTLVQNP
jgi:hypothetical protein